MSEHPPCPRCSFPYEPRAAERYWEGRWRDERAHNEGLMEALNHYSEQYCEGWCKDNPPNANFEDCGGCRARLAIGALVSGEKQP